MKPNVKRPLWKFVEFSSSPICVVQPEYGRCGQLVSLAMRGATWSFLARIRASQATGSGGIQYPGQGSIGGGNELRGRGFRIARALDHLRHYRGFVFSGDEKCYLGGVVEDRGGEGDPPGVDLIHMIGHDEALPLVKSGAMREERGSVSVGAQAKQIVIEPRNALSEREFIAQDSLIEIGGLNRSAVAGGNAVDVCGRNGNARKKQSARAME